MDEKRSDQKQVQGKYFTSYVSMDNIAFTLKMWNIYKVDILKNSKD